MTSSVTVWQTTRFRLSLQRPLIMGIVNVTPDSFSDGGQHATRHAALGHCEQLLRDGADILDLGAESTRPGATPLPVAQELERLLPLLREAVKLGVPISIDTYKPRVMQAALDLGADIINDIWALRWRDPTDPLDGRDVVAAHRSCGVCLMHMHGEPRTMQVQPMEGNIIPTDHFQATLAVQYRHHNVETDEVVRSFLGESAVALQALGVARERIALDPGVGFGKTVEQNFSTLTAQPALLSLGHPLLVGWSRKSSLGRVASPRDPASVPAGQHERLAPSLAAALLAAEHGAQVLRVHDVRDTWQALQVLQAFRAPSAIK